MCRQRCQNCGLGHAPKRFTEANLRAICYTAALKGQLEAAVSRFPARDWRCQRSFNDSRRRLSAAASPTQQEWKKQQHLNVCVFPSFRPKRKRWKFRRKTLLNLVVYEGKNEEMKRNGTQPRADATPPPGARSSHAILLNDLLFFFKLWQGSTVRAQFSRVFALNFSYFSSSH